MSSMQKLAAFVWVASTLLLAVLGLIGTDPQFRLYYSNALQVLSSLLSAGACFYAMSAFPAESPLRKVWLAIGAGVLAWGIGATIFGAYPVLHAGQDTPYPYWSDIGYLLTDPLIIVGLVLFTRATGLETPAWGWALALVLFLVGTALAYQANAEGIADPAPAMKAASIGYTLFDSALLGVLALDRDLVPRRRSGQGVVVRGRRRAALLHRQPALHLPGAHRAVTRPARRSTSAGCSASG
jgi:hypothetical protein